MKVKTRRVISSLVVGVVLLLMIGLLSACNNSNSKSVSTPEPVATPTKTAYNLEEYQGSIRDLLSGDYALKKCEMIDKDTNPYATFHKKTYSAEFEISIYPTKKAEYENATIMCCLNLYPDAFIDFEKNYQYSDLNYWKEFDLTDNSAYYFKVELDPSGYATKTVRIQYYTSYRDVSENDLVLEFRIVPENSLGHGYYSGKVILEE